MFTAGIEKIMPFDNKLFDQGNLIHFVVFFYINLINMYLVYF